MSDALGLFLVVMGGFVWPESEASGGTAARVESPGGRDEFCGIAKQLCRRSTS
ncbi:hypothetical protein CEXT_97411, partial [Caerostris extrusa]